MQCPYREIYKTSINLSLTVSTKDDSNQPSSASDYKIITKIGKKIINDVIGCIL